MSEPTSLRDWLVGVIDGWLRRSATPPPFVLWCDPKGEWPELLKAAATHHGFELWADPAEHELVTRDRLYREPRRPRVVWVPTGREGVSWLKVFELEATHVWERSLQGALEDYGVPIPRDMESDLAPALASYVREWFAEPRERWKEMTPGNARSALVGDDRVLRILAGTESRDGLQDGDRLKVFAGRAVHDFGLPDPSGMDDDAWRVASTARLLCTDAASQSPQDPPREGGYIIPAGRMRDNALGLLERWLTNVELLHSFEAIAKRADTLVGLSYWARGLPHPPPSKSSLAVEKALFGAEVEQLDRMEDVGAVAGTLAKELSYYGDRRDGFWERHSAERVGWAALFRLAEAASVLLEHEGIEAGWKSAAEAIAWYTAGGWRLDEVEKSLFEDWPEFPPELERVRTRLRRGYLRRLDSVERSFSELLAGGPEVAGSYPTAGEAALAELMGSPQQPTAIVFLDACRLELGHRLAEALNQGETTPRAEVRCALAPVPSITALGMPFALPVSREELRVTIGADGAFRIAAEGFDGNLTVAEQRRRWLAARCDVKKFCTMRELLEEPVGKRSGKRIVVWGDEFDQQGHDGRLQLDGADRDIERYARAIRRLREAGWSRVIVVTDHGFFHWKPEEDERVEEKPTGEVLWQSRRAMVGRDLKHPTAVRLPVPRSELEAMVPRSVNAFKTYGGLGFFHGGATLAELVIPVIVASWPAKAKKVGVVLKPVVHITSLSPRVQVVAAHGDQMVLAPSENMLSRSVRVKVVDPGTGKTVFKQDEPVVVDPSGDVVTVPLRQVESDVAVPFGARFTVQVLDADDDEPLAREEVTLKVQMDDW